jgi:short-subunit dehydrogenase
MKTTLITGASGGIGKEFAQIFARKGYNLVLVARNENKLQQIAKSFEKEYDIRVTVLPFDLSQTNSASKLYSEIKDRKIQIDILINNAGIGDYGYFMESDLKRTSDMINLNITTLTELSLLFLKEMKTRNNGKILNIASTASFQPVPKFAVYAATKSYVLNFTEALHYELKGTNVSASVLCPGPTSTGFEKSANMIGSNLFKSGVMKAENVAKIGYKGLMKDEMTIIPGFKNKIMAILSNMMPSRNLLVWISGKIS